MTPADVTTADGDVRYVPGDGTKLTFEALAHESRYRWAAPYVRDRRVLDFGCGSGFGSAGMAAVAREVEGVDYSGAAVAFATERFGGDRVRFLQGDVTDPALLGRLSPPYDTVVSFDVIEHVDRYLDFVANVVHVLAEDGVALIGCPNRCQTFALNQAWNRHHMQEFTPAQLRGLLKLFFGSVVMHSQEMSSPQLSALVRRQRGGSSWRSVARRILPEPLKEPLKQRLGSVATGGTFSLHDVEFLEEPGEEVLRQGFGLIAVCRQPRRDHPLT